MVETITNSKLKQTIYDSLKDTGWDNHLKGFFLSSEFDRVVNELITFVLKGKRFTPKFTDCFNAFKQCPFNKTRIVMIFDEPYTEFGWSSGVALDCSLQQKEHPYLRLIFDGLSRLYPGYKKNPDLSRWSQQGVLLLNTSLTAEIDKPGKHYNIWTPFMGYVLDMINVKCKKTIFVFIGNKAAEFSELINDRHQKFYVDHPSIAILKEDPSIEFLELFKKINEEIKRIKHIKQINW